MLFSWQLAAINCRSAITVPNQRTCTRENRLLCRETMRNPCPSSLPWLFRRTSYSLPNSPHQTAVSRPTGLPRCFASTRSVLRSPPPPTDGRNLLGSPSGRSSQSMVTPFSRPANLAARSAQSGETAHDAERSGDCGEGKGGPGRNPGIKSGRGVDGVRVKCHPVWDSFVWFWSVLYSFVAFWSQEWSVVP